MKSNEKVDFSLSNEELNNLVGVNESRVGATKFNSGLLFIQHLNQILRYCDESFVKERDEDYAKFLNCLYRNVYPYITDKIIAEEKFDSFRIIVDEYMRTRIIRSRQGLNMNRSMLMKIGEFHQYLLCEMRSKGLLIPESKTIGDNIRK